MAWSCVVEFSPPEVNFERRDDYYPGTGGRYDLLPMSPGRTLKSLADGVGFEPTDRLHDRRISSPVHSTALPPIPSHRPTLIPPGGGRILAPGGVLPR